MDPAFWLEELPVSETMMIVAHGELDLEAAPALSESLQVHRRTAARIVVDLREVTFMDSSGLAALAVNASDRDGLAPVQILAPLQHQPLHLLELTGLANLFTDHDAVG